MTGETIEAGLPEGFRAIVVNDETPDTSYLEQEGWETHLAAYRAGEFAYAGVILEKVCECCGEWRTAGSLWGIEHDGTQNSMDYLADTARELHSEEDAS